MKYNSKKYLIKYYYIMSDHIFATPEFHHQEIVECDVPRKLKEHIEKQTDGWGHHYIQKPAFGFDYTSKQGGVKVSEYKEKIKKL